MSIYLQNQKSLLTETMLHLFVFSLSQCFHNTFQRGRVCWIWIHLKWDRYHVIKEKLGDERRAGWKGKLYYKNLRIYLNHYVHQGYRIFEFFYSLVHTVFPSKYIERYTAYNRITTLSLHIEQASQRT